MRKDKKTIIRITNFMKIYIDYIRKIILKYEKELSEDYRKFLDDCSISDTLRLGPRGKRT